jgi:hypothetical protein
MGKMYLFHSHACHLSFLNSALKPKFLTTQTMHTRTSNFSFISDNSSDQTSQKHLKHRQPSHISQVRDELEQLLDDDNDMAELYLFSFKTG